MLKRALLVGIDKYSHVSPLSSATHDASEVGALLEMPEYGFDTERLLDDAASARLIQRSLKELLGSDADLKLFYFSGHGMAAGEDVHIVSSDGGADMPGVNLDWLRAQIAPASGSVLIILDCCHSGAASPKTPGGPRSITEGDLHRSFGNLPLGKIVMAACSREQYAFESSSLNHGVFTFHLLEGLMGSAADRRGLVTPMLLYDYVADALKEDGRQQPVWKGEQSGRLILGAGFSQGLLSQRVTHTTSLEPVTDEQLLAEIEEKAKGHLDEYLSQTNVHLNEWKESGYRKASQLLEPVIRWFDRQIRDTPELLQREGFRYAHAEAEARLAQLGALSEGTCTDEGQVTAHMGAGAFGTVWKVSTPSNGALAYKVYHANELHTKEKVARFERGYRAMSQLDHPHIVKVRRYTQAPVGFYMDFVDGLNLRSLAAALGDPKEVMALLINIAETLQHAHGRNVIHRDVKPENIVLTFDHDSKTWIPFLTDFDLAWFSTATQVTKDAFGAIYYAAPEQLAKPSSHAAHARTTDVFAFGQLAFFAATGSDPVPFGAADNVKASTECFGSGVASKQQRRSSACTTSAPGLNHRIEFPTSDS